MEEERTDSISGLPNEILQLIISSIPLKEAVRTSVLSTAWRSIWTPFQVHLDFEADEIASHEASKLLKQVIGTFLRSFDSPQLLKLSHGNSNKSLKLLMATKGVDRELHLDFSREDKAMSDFSLVLEASNSLIETNSFSSLRTLHLRSVTQLAGNFVSALFSNCQLLESLKLEKCSGLQDIDIKANNCFQRFTVMDCPKLIKITLSAPNLKSFWYRGALPTIQLAKILDLVDVVLDLRNGLGHNEFDCEDVISLLASLKDIEILTISGWLIEWLCTTGVIFGQLEFKFSKLKELWWIDSLMNRWKRDSLACFLNMTIFLEKLYVKIDQTCSPIPCPVFHQFWHEPHLWMDYATVKANASQLNHLKIVSLKGFTNEEDQLLLMDLLLQKAITLKSLMTESQENHTWQVSKIPQSQLKRTSACHSKRTIVVSSPNSQGVFVLTEEDNNGLRPETCRCF